MRYVFSPLESQAKKGTLPYHVPRISYQVARVWYRVYHVFPFNMAVLDSVFPVTEILVYSRNSRNAIHFLPKADISRELVSVHEFVSVDRSTCSSLRSLVHPSTAEHE